MKTSAMIAMLEKNPKQRYQFIFSDGLIWEAFNAAGSVRCIYGKGRPSERTDFLTTDSGTMAKNWQPVREPVPWQEAIQAWAEGKTISCKVQGRATSVFMGGGFILLDKGGATICKEDLFNGRWFIEEGEAE